MALVSDIAAKLKISAREAPNITLERLVRESAREFFRKSRTWRLNFVGSVTATNAAYDLNLPTDTLAYAILYAKLRTANVKLTYLRDADNAYEYPDDLITPKTPEYIKLLDDNTFQIYPPPQKDDVIEMKVVLCTTRVAAEVDDEIYEEFEDPIISGALARLFEMPNETWSDLKLAKWHKAKFESETEQARLRGQETETPGVRNSRFSW